MAAVQEAALTNGFEGIRLNGHNSEEETSTKEIQPKVSCNMPFDD